MARFKGSAAFETKEEAEAHQAKVGQNNGSSGYHETYPDGVRPCRLAAGFGKPERDGWASYYHGYSG